MNLKNALKVGYEQGKDQNILKETYIDVLNDACKVIDLALTRLHREPLI